MDTISNNTITHNNEHTISYTFSSPYKLVLLKNNYWHDLVSEYYQHYKSNFKPINLSVTYLVFSGVSFTAFNQSHFPIDMCDSYANAFQVHQKPYKTAAIHKKYIKEFTYFWYLGLIAYPVDVYAHTMQFLFGERNEFLEGGAFFLPYMVLHWTLLLFTLIAPYIYKYFPEYTWRLYFSLIYHTLAINEYCYKLCIRKLSLSTRILEFTLFCCALYIPIQHYCKYNIMLINYTPVS